MAKETVYYKGKYFQGNMSDDQAEAILTLITEYDEVKSLIHCIKNVPEHIIIDIKRDAEDYERANSSLEGFKHKYHEEVGLGTLRDAQTIGVAFMYYSGSALLGDEVGLGKTVQIAGLCNILTKELENADREFRYLFLTEKSSAGQIRDKMIQFTGEYVELIESGEKEVIADYLLRHGKKKHCSFVGSHSLMNSPEFLTHVAKHPFDLVIIDESSIAKNQASEFYINCKSLFKFIKRKILLNATPIELAVREMYNQLDLLDPNFMPTVGDFNKRYTKTKRGMFGYQPDGYKNQEEFKEAVTLRYLARTRADLGAKYSDNMYKTILIPLSPEQKKLSKKTTLHQMVTDYPTGVDRNLEFNEFTTPKLAVLFKIIEEAIGVFQNQALVYCRFIEAQEKMKQMLIEKGYRVVVLNGQSKTTARADIVNDFNQGQYDILITNVLRGIDLKTCDNCILYTIDPNPQKMVQFEGRMTRELDILYKSVFLLVAMGKEKKFVEDKLKLRVGTSDAFTNTGNSMVLSAIKSDENKEMYEADIQFSPDDDID
jgi:SNF2 family DNA or RNA helicase